MTTEPTVDRFAERDWEAEERIEHLSGHGFLTEQQVEVYVYRELENWSREETADQLDLAEPAVYESRRDAVEKLRAAENTISALTDTNWWPGPVPIVFGNSTDESIRTLDKVLQDKGDGTDLFIMAAAPPVKLAQYRNAADQKLASGQADTNADSQPTLSGLVGKYRDRLENVYVGPEINPDKQQTETVVSVCKSMDDESVDAAQIVRAVDAAFAELIDEHIREPEQTVISTMPLSQLDGHIVRKVHPNIRFEKYNERGGDIDPALYMQTKIPY